MSDNELVSDVCCLRFISLELILGQIFNSNFFVELRFEGSYKVSQYI